MKERIRKKIVKFICQPLMAFKNEFERGEEIFAHLFYDRTNDRSQLRSSLELSRSMTIVGNPGEGKTCLMHYMFIQMKNDEKIFPIILDYRYCSPRKKETLIIKFVENIKKYFKDIGCPLHVISEETTTSNYDTHHRLIMDHLRKIKMDQIQRTKKVAIFLDDLDYYEGDYLSLLREYFLPFALNPKTVLVLSGRKPLINSISEDHELRHAFNLNPRKIFLVRVDLKTLFESRLSAILPEKEEKTLFKLFNAFKNPSEINRMLRSETLKYITGEAVSDNSDGNAPEEMREDDLHIKFGFNDMFWTHLGDVTGRNLRQIEEMLPELCYFHWINSGKDIDFNTNFTSAYILAMYKEPNYLLDLVSIKTTNKKLKLNGNSIYENVLEYFYSNSIVNDAFYLAMAELGIHKAEADEAIKILSHAPYALFDPEYVYFDNSVFRQYKLNRKGKFYLDYILTNQLYYEKLTERFALTHDDAGGLPGNNRVTRSSRNYLNSR
jgi:hypothetical protein